MIKLIPPQLEVLVEIYNIAKSLRRNEKPDYLKIMKKVICKLGGDSAKTRKSNTLDQDLIPEKKKNSHSSQNDSVDEEEIAIKIDKINGKDKRSDRVK